MYICSVLSNFIINNYIKKYVNSYLCKEFYFFDKKERENIIKDVLSKVDRDVISDNLKRFIDDKGKIVLDGYFRFRMQDYVEHIELIVCEAVTDIMLENEENEFVNLLKYFVSIGDGACETVHVFKKDSDYILTDDIGNSPVDMVNVMYEFSDLENLPEDTLLSNLVSIAP